MHGSVSTNSNAYAIMPSQHIYKMYKMFSSTPWLITYNYLDSQH